MQSNINFNTDPKYIGPGIWFTLHTLAKNAVTKADKGNFLRFLMSLREDFPCPNCRIHINNFLEIHPPDPFMKSSAPDSLFKYTWIFHNHVNSRLHKSIVPWETAKAFYYHPNLPSGVCQSNCDGHTDTSKPTEIKKEEPTFYFNLLSRT